MFSEKAFLDQTFQVFKANGTILFDKENLGTFKGFLSQFSQFLYRFHSRVNPQLVNGESLIASIETYGDILNELVTSSGTDKAAQKQENYVVNYFSVRHPNARVLSQQSVIFISKDTEPGVDEGKAFSTLVLVKSSNPSICEALLRIVECVEHEYPLIIKPSRISQDFIKNTINSMGRTSTAMDVARALGDIEFTFRTGSLTGENLKNITITVPLADLQKVEQVRTQKNSEEEDKQHKLVDELFAHLKGVTAINFHEIPLSRFLSRIVNISQDGRIKIHKSIQNYYRSSAEETSIVWSLMISLYNETYEN